MGGSSAINCAGHRLDWEFPSWTGFVEVGSSRGGRKIEIAPTAWTDPSQIDLSDPHLKWYRYDEARDMTPIPLTELPGGRPDTGKGDAGNQAKGSFRERTGLNLDRLRTPLVSYPNNAFALAHTLSTVNPYSFSNTSAGAEAPKRSTPSTAPRSPT